MKTRSVVKLMTTALLSLWLVNGCATQSSSGAADSKASPEATAAIGEANAAIAKAKANDWIWRDTEKFLKEAQEAADKGDNKTAVKLAKKAKEQAEDAVSQYNYEKANPRGL